MPLFKTNTMEILPQILVLAITASALYALIAAGLTLTFGTLEFINFAHGDMAMAGAFSFYAFYMLMGLPFIPSFLLTIALTALIGIIIERTTFRPVRAKQAFIPLILSIGIAIILQALAIMFFGGGSQSYFQPGETLPVYNFFDGSIIITLTQIIIVISAVVLITAIWIFLKKTKTGKAIRAVSDNRELAAIMGIDVNRSIAILFAMAASLAGFAGVLIAYDQNLYPTMGVIIGIKAFAAIVLGGVGNLKGAVLGAIIIGFSENLIIGLTPLRASYKELVVFTIFILVLLIKPYGIYGGRKEEIETR